MLAAISDPIAASIIDVSASATRTSTRVKPASPLRSGCAVRGNFDTSRQPVDTDLVADPLARQYDRAAARHAGWKEVDRASGCPTATTGRHCGLHVDIPRQVQHAAAV